MWESAVKKAKRGKKNQNQKSYPQFSDIIKMNEEDSHITYVIGAF